MKFRINLKNISISFQSLFYIQIIILAIMLNLSTQEEVSNESFYILYFI